MLSGHRVELGAVMADGAIRAIPGMAAIEGLPPPRVMQANRRQPLWDSVDPEMWLPQDNMKRTLGRARFLGLHGNA